jgi:hypothetical protein
VTSTPTNNFGFRLIDFDTPAWHDLEHANWQEVDALIGAVYSITGFRGVWLNSTAYAGGDRAVDIDTGTIYEALVGHVSAATGSFAADRIANPANWGGVSGFGDFLAKANNLSDLESVPTARTNLALVATPLWCGNAAGTANAIEITSPQAFPAYVNGMQFVFTITAVNHTATTLQVDALAALPVRMNNTALTGGEFLTGDIVSVRYIDGVFHARQEATVQASAYGQKNYILNSTFDITQWGISPSVGAGGTIYVVDQWEVAAGAVAVAVSRPPIVLGTTTLPHEQSYHLRLNSAAVDLGALFQPIEHVTTLAGKVVSLTFWARSSVAGAQITPVLRQNFGAGGSADVETSGSASTLSTSFQRFRHIMTIPNIAGKVIGSGSFLSAQLHITDSAGLDIDIAKVQLQEGPRYTVISPTSPDDDLKACMRYLQTSYDFGVPVGTAPDYNGAHQSYAYSSIILAQTVVDLTVPMRTQPTITLYSTQTGVSGHMWNASAGADAATAAGVNPSIKSFIIYSAGADLVPGNLYTFHWMADARL